MRTIKRNDTGEAVADVQRRLRVLGYELSADGKYLDRTQEAVRQFRLSAGLPEGDTVDDQTWSALVDASFILGDRILYLRMPYFHGGDVETLQNIMNVLGFVIGEPDGIFGARTEHALREFQASVGLVDDGIAGTSTYEVIERLRHAWEGKSAASAEEVSAHGGFARAAEALSKVVAVFYGLDPVGRGVAARAANLARATTAQSKIVSADALIGVAPSHALMLGISTEGSELQDGVPAVGLSEDAHFSARLRIALESAQLGDSRVIVTVPVQGASDSGEMVSGERWEQHLAVTLLDAFCAAQQ
jgi:peptidoglycan hydrolase-like protein with peptidoglycan-binding domain